MTGDFLIAAASRVLPSQRSESERTCRKFATPVASIVCGATEYTVLRQHLEAPQHAMQGNGRLSRTAGAHQ